MNSEEICVNWRAVILPENGAQPIHGRLRKLSQGQVVVGTDRNLMPGHHCNLSLMLPKNTPHEPNRLVEGRGKVVLSVLSTMQFHVTVEWMELKGNGANLLNEQIRMHGQAWKRQH